MSDSNIFLNISFLAFFEDWTHCHDDHDDDHLTVDLKKKEDRLLWKSFQAANISTSIRWSHLRWKWCCWFITNGYNHNINSVAKLMMMMEMMTMEMVVVIIEQR